MFASKTHEITAALAALDRSYAVIEFKMDGTIITANANFLAVTGYRLADISGRSHAIFVAAKERHGMAYQRFWDGLKQGEFRAGEYRHIGKHGRDVWLQASYNPILRRNGKPFKVIAFATDITARIRRDSGQDGDGGASRLVPEALALDRAGRFDPCGRPHAVVWRSGVPLVTLTGRLKDAGQGAGEAPPEASESASRIVNVVAMINRIAAENNLAALRATIEAARAGDAMAADAKCAFGTQRPGRMA